MENIEFGVSFDKVILSPIDTRIKLKEVKVVSGGGFGKFRKKKKSDQAA